MEDGEIDVATIQEETKAAVDLLADLQSQLESVSLSESSA